MRILILGTVRRAHKIVAGLGHEMILMITKSTVKPTDINDLYSNIVIMDEKQSDQAWVDMAYALHQSIPFDAVCSFNDGWQRQAIKICDKLGLYFPINENVLNIVFDKYQTRKILTEHGLDNTFHTQINSSEELKNITVSEANYPVILKPLKGTASRGVIKINREDDITEVTSHYENSGCKYPAILESFIGGEEFSVEGFSSNGKYHQVAVVKKYKNQQTFVEIGHATPTQLSDEKIAQISNFLGSVLDALGIENGPSHSEIIVSGENIFLIETHTRPGGDFIPELVDQTTGINVYELIISQALGQSISDVLAAGKQVTSGAAIWFMSPSYAKGTKITGLPETETLVAKNGVLEIQILKAVGDEVGDTKSSFDRILYVIAELQSANKALKIAREVVDSLSYAVQQPVEN